MEPDNSGFIPLTIIFLGQLNTGKTSLIKKYKYQRNFEFPIIHDLTLNFNIYNKAIFFEKYNIKCEMWDTIGLEVGKDLSLKISNKANCAVFVFDISNKQSFENLNEYIIKYKKICENNNKKFNGIVFGNKCDKQNREVNIEEAKSFSIKYGMKYYDVNALNDRRSLNVIIKAIEELLNTVLNEQKSKK